MKFYRIDRVEADTDDKAAKRIVSGMAGRVRSESEIERIEKWLEKRYGTPLYIQQTHVVAPAHKLNQRLIPIFDRAHGLFNQDGTNYQGKASPAYNYPDKFPDDQHLVFREAEFSENITDRVCAKLERTNYEYERIIPDNDMTDRSNTWRRDAINAIAENLERRGLSPFTISNHANAAGMGDEWKSARGAAVFTYYGQSASDNSATRLFLRIEKRFPEWDGRLFKDMRDGDPDLEAGFYSLAAHGRSVLIEWGFQDNRDDVALLLDDSFRERIATTLFDWIVDEIGLF